MPGRILIADDLAPNRILLKARLAGAPYEVVAAESRAALPARAASEAPDLILLDMAPPTADALATITALRAQDATAAVPVLALAPRPLPALRRAALAAGADDLLPRRASDALLLARIRSLLRAATPETGLSLRGEEEAALGFAESAPVFEPPGLVALVATDSAQAEARRRALAPALRDRIAVITPQALHAVGTDAPDVIVVDAAATAAVDALRLVADLRASPATRSSRILALAPPGDEALAAEALDIGADDVAETGADAGELVLRLRALLRRKARADRLRRRLADGLRLAVTDPLTGLYNRRYALARLRWIAEESAAAGRSFAVMVLDLDRFKRVNDTHGHGAGDAALVEIARRIGRCLRAEDLLARLGGEEFLVALPGAGAEEARRAAERLRAAVSAVPIPVAGLSQPLTLTVSIGVAIGAPGAALPAPPVDALVVAADRALYAAKADGRNQVSLGSCAA